MTTTTETPGAHELPLARSPESTPTTVAASSHASALAALDTPSKYTQLIAEHTEMIESGKTSRQIISHIWKKLNIEKWGREEFLGECEFLPTPTESEIPRLQEYLSALGVEWSLANGGSDNHPEFFLIDAQSTHALVGVENMKKANALLYKFHEDWQAAGKDETQKEALLKKYLGLSEVDWAKLIGLRASNGKSEGGGGLSIYGELDTDKIKALRLWVTKDGPRGGSVVGKSPASYGRLFALAQIAPTAVK